MSPIAQLLHVTRGWAEILAGRPGWRAHFALTPGGFAVAALGYAVVVVMSLGAGIVIAGMPSPAAAVMAGLVNLLPLFGLTLATLLTYLSLRVERPMLDLLVPGIHALSLVLLLGTVLALFGLGYGPLMLGILAIMLVRAAQVAGGFGPGVSLAFAALAIVVLVVLPNSLYMLVIPPPPTPSG